MNTADDSIDYGPHRIKSTAAMTPTADKPMDRSETMDIFEKLRAVKTMPELDALRMETVAAMTAAGEEGFKEVQRAFIAAKNRLLAIPLRERTW